MASYGGERVKVTDFSTQTVISPLQCFSHSFMLLLLCIFIKHYLSFLDIHLSTFFTDFLLYGFDQLSAAILLPIILTKISYVLCKC